MKFTEEEKQELINKFIDTDDLDIKCMLVSYGFGLDKFIDDDCWEVRLEVAKQGYGLNKLINDEKWEVRLSVAEQGYGLDKLVDDENKEVRKVALKNILKQFKQLENKNHIKIFNKIMEV